MTADASGIMDGGLIRAAVLKLLACEKQNMVKEC